MTRRRPEQSDRATLPDGWPGWARAAASAVLIAHLVAIGAAALAVPPSSELLRSLAERFGPYHRLLDQGYAYRYYTSGAPPTPIVEARLEFDDGRVEELRIPDRSARPRLRFQRQLALAYHLFDDVRRAPIDERGRVQSRWAESYGRHLCRANPGCSRVVLYLREHRNPSPQELVEAAEAGRAIDVESERYYTRPQRIGAYLCDD